MTWFTIDQYLQLGTKCSHCNKNAKWLGPKDSPAYCDEHFPYWDCQKSQISVDNPEDYVER